MLLFMCCASKMMISLHALDQTGELVVTVITIFPDGQRGLCSEQTYKALVDLIIKQSQKNNKNKTTLASVMK